MSTPTAAAGGGAASFSEERAIAAAEAKVKEARSLKYFTSMARQQAVENYRLATLELHAAEEAIAYSAARLALLKVVKEAALAAEKALLADNEYNAAAAALEDAIAAKKADR